MKVQHTTINNYIAGINKEEVDYVLRYGKLPPVDYFNIGALIKKPFGVVKDAQHLFNKVGAKFDKYIELLYETFDIDIRKIGNESVYNIHSSRLWMKEEVDKINKLEADNLGYEPTYEEAAADIDRFNMYGNYPQFRNLAGTGDYDKIEQIKKWPYEFCFMEMKYNKDVNEYEKEVFRIRNLKNK